MQLTIQEVIEARQAAAEKLDALLNQTAKVYQDLASLTGDLHQKAFRAHKARHGTAPASDPLHGLSGYPERVKSMIEWRIFGSGNGRTIDLVAIVKGENDRAARYVQQMEVKNG